MAGLLVQCALAACVATAVAVLPSAAAEKRLALVIGNGGYRNAPALITPANDATDLAAAFGKLGFAVILGTDLDASAMAAKVVEFRAALADAKFVAVYYAGLDVSIAGRAYLVPVDATLGSWLALRHELIPLSDIIGSIEEGSGASMVLIDAGRPIRLLTQLALNMGAVGRTIPIDNAIYKLQLSRSGMLVMVAHWSSDNAETSSQQRNGRLATSLIARLGTPGQDISATLDAVAADVQQASDGQQTLARLSGSQSLGVLKEADPTPPQATPDAGTATVNDAYALALSSNTVSAYQSFIDSYPNDPRVPQLAMAVQHYNAWSVARQQDTIAAYEGYLSTYPEGSYAAQARERIAALNQQAATAPSGPSFDCVSAQAADEMAICANADLIALDRSLDDLYRDLEPRLAGDQRDILVSGEKEWLTQRAGCQSDVACIDRLYHERIDALRQQRAAF